MPNMSYCRFENTVSDMRDCIGALEECNYDLQEMMDDASSEHEAKAMRRFVKVAREIAEAFDGDDLDSLEVNHD